MGSIEILIHNLAMAAWDAGCDSGVAWCQDADMSKRGVVPMTQEEGLRNSREHFASHGGGGEASEFDSALRSLRAALVATPPPDVVAVLQRFVDWCEKYPSSRIYDHCQIITIARIMDEIHADAKRALRSGEAGKKGAT